MNRKVIVYTQVTCKPCQEEKLWLKEHRIPFEERDVRINDVYFQEAIDLGASSTPVTLIEQDGQKQVVLGFDIVKLKELLDME